MIVFEDGCLILFSSRYMLLGLSMKMNVYVYLCLCCAQWRCHSLVIWVIKFWWAEVVRVGVTWL